MTSTTTDRLAGVTASLASKAPVRAATTASIAALSGLKTIDAVVLVADDRVLVKDQADGIENGIYDVKSGAWVRSLDFDGTRDVVSGTFVVVSEGTAGAGTIWRISTTGDITIGTTSIAFAQTGNDSASAFMATLLDDADAAAARATLLAQFDFGIFNVKDPAYGAVGDGVTDDTTAIQSAATAVKTAGGGTLYFPPGTYIVNKSILISSNTHCLGAGDSSIIKAHQTSWVGIPANNDTYLLTNENRLASVLTDSDLIVEKLTLDYGTVTIVGGGAHHINFRFVDRVTIRDVYGLNGETVTAMMACRDTVVDSCRALDQTNSYFDHWDGAGNGKVVNCTGRTTKNIDQGIQFTGTGTFGENRTSVNCVVAHCSVYNVRNAAGTASALIANAVDADSASFRYTSIGNYVEDSDLGLVWSGEGGQHLSIGDTFNTVDQLPIFLQKTDSDTPDNCRVLYPHFIDCDHDAGNVALIQFSGTGHRIRGLKITNAGAAPYALIAWFTTDATDCILELESGDDGTVGTVQNNGTTCAFVGASGEGAWTPVLTFVTPGDLSVAYSVQFGRYVKQGNTVTVYFNVQTSTFTYTTATGNLRLTGLPFTSASASNLDLQGSTVWGGVTKAGYTGVSPVVVANTALIEFSASGSGVAPSSVDVADALTTSTVFLRGSITYLTEAN